MYKPVALTGEKFHDPDDESDDHGWKNALWQADDSDGDEDEPGRILVDELTYVQISVWEMAEEISV